MGSVHFCSLSENVFYTQHEPPRPANILKWVQLRSVTHFPHSPRSRTLEHTDLRKETETKSSTEIVSQDGQGKNAPRTESFLVQHIQSRRVI